MILKSLSFFGFDIYILNDIWKDIGSLQLDHFIKFARSGSPNFSTYFLGTIFFLFRPFLILVSNRDSKSVFFEHYKFSR